MTKPTNTALKARIELLATLSLTELNQLAQTLEPAKTQAKILQLEAENTNLRKQLKTALATVKRTERTLHTVRTLLIEAREHIKTTQTPTPANPALAVFTDQRIKAGEKILNVS